MMLEITSMTLKNNNYCNRQFERKVGKCISENCTQNNWGL